MFGSNISGKLLTLLVLLLVSRGRRATRKTQNVRVVLTSVEYRKVNNTLLKFDYSIMPAKYDSVLVNLNATSPEDVNSIMVKIKVDFVRNGKRYTYLDIKYDLCDELVRIQSNIFLRAGFTGFRHCSNVPFACPFKKNHLYSVQNFTFYDTALPSYIPEMDFVLLADVWLKETFVFNLTAHGKFTKTEDNRRVWAMKC